RTLRYVVDLADDLQPVAGAHNARQQVGQPRIRTFQGRGHQSGRHDRRLDQSEVVVSEVEQLVQAVDVLARAQVNARQPEDRLRDHPQPRLDRRPWDRVAPVYT